MTVLAPEWLAPLQAALAEPGQLDRWNSLRPARGGRPAAVLVLIGSGPSGPEIVFIERAATLRSHASQIAFPGGAADPGDLDLADTALREATEEIGVDRAGIRVLGQLPPVHVSVSGFDVSAVIGWWHTPMAVRAVDLAEVASVPVVPVSELTDPANRAQVYHPSGYVGPAFAVQDHLIWGLTAHLLDGVLDLAGWQRPWDRSRSLSIPARYLTGRPDAGGPDAH